MTWELFEHIIRDIASWPQPLKELVPTNFGELQMNRDWERMLHLVEEKLPRTGIVIVTTGTLMTDEFLEKLALVKTVKLVNFSINAYFAETWSRIMRLPEKLMPRAVQAVHDFRSRRPDVDVHVSMVYDQELMTELERDLFYSYWSQFGPTELNNVSYAGHPTRRSNPPTTLPCRSIFDGLTVFDTGLVGSNCCFDGDADSQLKVGSVPEERLLDIWHGEKLRKLAGMHNNGMRNSLNLCSGCTFA